MNLYLKFLSDTPKFLVILLLLIASYTVTNGQSAIGFSAGILTTPFHFVDTSPYASGEIDFKNSFALGLTYNEQFKSFLIGTNVSYNYYVLDFKENGSGKAGQRWGEDINYKYGYVYIYIYPEFVFGNDFQFLISAGPTIGILAHSNMSGSTWQSYYIDGEYHYEEKEISGSGKSKMKNILVGIQTELGFKYKLNESWSVKLTGSCRYSPFHIKSDYAKSQLDIIPSIGIEYIPAIRKK